MSKFELVMHRGWDTEILSSDDSEKAVALHTAEIAALAIKEAPRRSAIRNNWNSIKRNIEAMTALYDVWYGQVVVEFNEEVTHAMLQERGWTDQKGRRHPGRRYLKEALLKARID